MRRRLFTAVKTAANDRELGPVSSGWCHKYIRTLNRADGDKPLPGKAPNSEFPQNPEVGFRKTLPNWYACWVFQPAGRGPALRRRRRAAVCIFCLVIGGPQLRRLASGSPSFSMKTNIKLGFRRVAADNKEHQSKSAREHAPKHGSARARRGDLSGNKPPSSCDITPRHVGT